MAHNAATLNGSNKRCTLSKTYAQITGIEVDYGNLSKLMHHYTERDLYLMALRNGLEDRTYADWTRTKRVAYHQLKDYDNDDEFLETADKDEFFGVGSVLRIIPGVDICSGAETTLVGGMKVYNETIRFTVNYRPLNMFNDNLRYSLYVAFEFNGVVTITKGECDIAMIHIDSVNQLLNAELVPSYGIAPIYGRGFLDKMKEGINKVNNFVKDTGIVSTAASLIPGKIGKTASGVLGAFGYGYTDEDYDDDDDDDTYRTTTRMRGGKIIPPGSFYETY